MQSSLWHFFVHWCLPQGRNLSQRASQVGMGSVQSTLCLPISFSIELWPEGQNRTLEGSFWQGSHLPKWQTFSQVCFEQSRCFPQVFLHDNCFVPQRFSKLLFPQKHRDCWSSEHGSQSPSWQGCSHLCFPQLSVFWHRFWHENLVLLLIWQGTRWVCLLQ